MVEIKIIGINVMRFGVAFILIMFGIYKFTLTEAKAIEPLINNSFIFNWLLKILPLRTMSAIIGVTEIIVAICLASRFYSPKIAFYGSILGVIIFLTTISFLFTTPGLIAKSEWLWLSDGFITKDLVLLGFCIWSTGEAYNALSIK
jgi:reactive chlorine resistance protein C